MKRSARIALLVGGIAVAATAADAMTPGSESRSAAADGAVRPSAPAGALGGSLGELAAVHDRRHSRDTLPDPKRPKAEGPKRNVPEKRLTPGADSRGGFGSMGKGIGSGRS